MAIEGRIDLNLFPRPTLSLARTTLASPPESDDGVRLEVDRLDLALKPLPLLRGQLDVAEMRLVRPVWRVERAPDGRSKLKQLAGVAAWLPVSAEAPSRVSVIDGRATLPELAYGRASRLDQVNLELSAADTGGAVMVAGTLALNGQPLRVDARFGRPTPEGSSTLRLELSTEGLGDAGASTATFGGVVWWRADAPGLRGELVITGADARSTVGALRAALGQEILPMPPWPGRCSGYRGGSGSKTIGSSCPASRSSSTEPSWMVGWAWSWPPCRRSTLRPTHGSSRFRPICPPMRWARGLRPSLLWSRRCAARSIWRWARSTTRACRCSACVRPCSSAAMALRPSAMPGSRCPARPKSGSRASSRAPARMRSCAAS